MTTDVIYDEPKLVWEGGAQLGEGPVWVDREQALYWVDIIGLKIHRLKWPSKEQKSWNVPTKIGTIHPTEDGNFIGALKTGIYKLTLPEDSSDVVLKLLADPEPDLPDNRFNDGKIGPDGSFWTGSMDDNEEAPTGRLYRFTGSETQVIDTDYVITNGPGFSLDGKRIYHTDTLKKIIYGFDLENGNTPSNKQVFIQIPEDEGYPDGMTIDDEDCIWQCHFAGARITRFTPDGQKLMHIPMPVSNITSCVFGGKDLSLLFVTTADKNLSPEQLAKEPDAGGLFVIQTNISGPKTRYFQEK